MTGEAGFSLVEVLIATFITSVLMVMGAAFISDTLTTREVLSETVEDAQELELARTLMKADLAQLVPRRAREDFGAPLPSPFMGGVGAPDGALMVFVRAGNSFPGLELVGSRLQYVEYLAEDGALVRRTRDFVDGVPGTPRRDRIILSDVANVDIAFLRDASWSDSWHQSEALRCERQTDDWGLLSLRTTYGAGEGPDWGWHTSFALRPTGQLVMQMTNVTPWGEHGRAVRMVFERE